MNYLKTAQRLEKSAINLLKTAIIVLIILIIKGE